MTAKKASGLVWLKPKLELLEEKEEKVDIDMFLRFFSKFIVISLFFTSFLLPQKINATQLNALNQDEYVVILHGIARSKKHMQKLADYLSKNNYDVLNIDYPSTSHNLEELSQIIKKDISGKITQDKKVNFVGYSMGGLLVRIILNQQNYKNMGRVVMLAAPNKGSEVADFLENNWIYNKIYGPAGKELITDQKKIKKLLNDKIDYELGIIAGNATIDPISSSLIAGDDDGKVSIESTKLEGMKDHIIVSATHTFFTSNKNVKEQTLYFLQNGKFKK